MVRMSEPVTLAPAHGARLTGRQLDRLADLITPYTTFRALCAALRGRRYRPVFRRGNVWQRQLGEALVSNGCHPLWVD